MKRIHLLRYDGDPADLAPLLDAARREDLRIGWLDLPAEGPGPVPPELASASSTGAFRAVAVGPDRTVAVKAPGGPPVLRDLLREHFLGCTLVVVRVAEGSSLAGALGSVAVLEAVEGGFRVRPPGEAGRISDASTLAARLRRPRPW